MAVSTDLNKHIYVGNGTNKTWSVTFRLLQASDLHLYLTNTETSVITEITTNYSISPTGGSYPCDTATVTYPSSGDAITSTYKLTLIRQVAVTQTTVYPTNTALKPKTVEKDLDKSAMIDQQLAEELARCIKTPISDGSTLDTDEYLTQVLTSTAAALVSETNAKTSETNAANSETAAANSATAASQTETYNLTVAAKDAAEAAATSTELLAAAALTGSPKGVYTYLSELQAAYPTGNTNVYLVLGNIAEVDTLSVTGAPTTSGNITITLDSTAKTVAVTAGTAEVASLTISAACTAAENATVTLNGVATTVALTTAMNTAALVATAIRETTFSGWTTGGSDAVVTFTATAVGTKTDATYSAGTTGATGTMSTTTQGTDADTAPTVATKIRATAFTGWTITGTETTVIYTATATGAKTVPVFAAGTTGVTATFTVTDPGADADGHWYFWNGTTWADGGIYQSTGINDNTIEYRHIYSKTALSNINPSNLFDNPMLENNFAGWLLLNNDGHIGTEVSLTDSFSKGVSVPITVSGNSLIQKVPLTKLVTGEYKIRCKKKTSGSTYNGRLVIQLSNSSGSTLYQIYDSGTNTTALLEHTFTFNKESLLPSYPTAVYLTITFKHTNPSADCTFYEPFIGLTSNNTKYNNYKYEELQSNPLTGKIDTFDGDSICQGLANGGGYAKILAETEGMIVENKGIGGGTIAKGTYYDAEHTNPRHWICDSVTAMRSDADYAIWEGGRNDYGVNVPLGVLTTDYVSAVDNTTFYGALESLFRQALVRFKGKKVGFIIIHKPNAEPYTANSIGLKLDDYYNAIIATCNKYSIPVCDLYKTSSLITAITDLKTTYTDSADGLHPNALGYEKYYVPKISAWMKTL